MAAFGGELPTRACFMAGGVEGGVVICFFELN